MKIHVMFCISLMFSLAMLLSIPSVSAYVGRTATTQTSCSDNQCTKTLFSGTRFALDANSEWVNPSEVLYMTRVSDDIYFHYNGSDGYYYLTLETGVIYNGAYYPMATAKQMKPGIQFSFPSEKKTTYHKYAVNISNLTGNLNSSLIEYVTLTYKDHYGFNLASLKQENRRFKVRDTMQLLFSDLFEKYIVTLNVAERRVYIGNITANVVDGELYLDPTVTLQDNVTENLEDAYVTDIEPNLNFGSSTILVAGANGETNGEAGTFIKFNTSGILSSGEAVDSSDVCFYVYSNAYSSGDTRITMIHNVTNKTWNEDNITWNDKPVAGEQLDNISFNAGETGWFCFNVTSWVATEMGGNVSFYWNATRDDFSSYLWARSKEYITDTALRRPALNITYYAVKIRTNQTFPSSPQYYDSVKINANVTSGDDTITWVNFTLTSPNGTKVIDNINGTNYNTDLWNSTSYVMDWNGSWQIDINASDSLGNSDSTTWNFSITMGTMTVKTPEGDQNWSFSQSAGGEELLNLSLSHTGNSNNTIDFYLTGDLDNATRFTVTFEEDPTNITASATKKLQVNITSNTTLETGEYTGNITWNRTNPNTPAESGNISFNITVSELVGKIDITDTSWSASILTGQTDYFDLTLNATGEYSPTSCNFVLSTTISGASLSSNKTGEFSVENGTTETVEIGIISTTTGSDAESLITIECQVTSSGGLDSDTVSGSLAVSLSGTELAGGGGAPPATIIPLFCGNLMCDGNETFETCPMDCSLPPITETPAIQFEAFMFSPVIGAFSPFHLILFTVSGLYISRIRKKRLTPTHKLFVALILTFIGIAVISTISPDIMAVFTSGMQGSIDAALKAMQGTLINMSGGA